MPKTINLYDFTIDMEETAKTDNPLDQMVLAFDTLPVMESIFFPMRKETFVPFMATMLDEWLCYHKLDFSEGEEMLKSIIEVRDSVNATQPIEKVPTMDELRQIFKK